MCLSVHAFVYKWVCKCVHMNVNICEYTCLCECEYLCMWNIYIYANVWYTHTYEMCENLYVCACTHIVPEGSTQSAQLSLSMHGTGSSTCGQSAGNSERWVLWHEGQRTIHAPDLCCQPPLYVQPLFPQFEGREWWTGPRGCSVSWASKGNSNLGIFFEICQPKTLTWDV